MATQNAVGNGLSGATGTGSFVGSTSPTLVTPTLGAASATSIAFSSTTEIIGTTTNNNAAAGSVGELISSVIVNASAVSISTTNTAQNITSISLTAGDWDVWGNLVFQVTAGTCANIYCWISSTSATLPDSSVYSTTFADTGTASIGQYNSLIAPELRFSLSGTTTIYLQAQAGFSISMNTRGGIYARRVR